MRTWFQAACFMLMVFCGCSLCRRAYADDDMREVAGSLAKQVAGDADVAPLKGQRVFVAEFNNINARGDSLAQIFQENLTTACIMTKQFDVVERAQLEKALQETANIRFRTH